MSDENKAIPHIPAIQQMLIEAYRSGTLMDVIDESCRSSDITKEDIAHELAMLHNDGRIDIVETFSKIRKNEANFNFFHVRRVFEHALPEIESDVMTAIRYVRHLVHEAGHDTNAVLCDNESEHIIASRTEVLEQAFMKYPNRFKYQTPQHPSLVQKVWINKPRSENEC